MSEIEKLYKNASVTLMKVRTCEDHDCNNIRCSECEYFKDNIFEFTSKKQLELIKFLMKQEDFSWTIVQQGKDTEYVFYVGYEYGSGNFKEFPEAVAGIVNDLWQDLTEEERKQVKEILE